jgi:hypothetical protein
VHSHLVVSFNNLSRHFAYWLTSAAFFFGWRMGNGQSGQLPQTMRRIVLVEPNKELAQARLEVQEAPVPTPASGEVLIRVSAAPGKENRFFLSSPCLVLISSSSQSIGLW